MLTVSDIDGFAEQGGMVSLDVANKGVKVEINQAATEQAGLKISAQAPETGAHRENPRAHEPALETKVVSGTLPIQRKMLLMTLLVCGTVLLVAFAALFTFQVVNFRSNFRRDTATLATIIANNSTAALAFLDAKGAAEVVGSLSAKATVVSIATLTLPDGSVFARFGEQEGTAGLREFPPSGQFLFTGGQLLQTRSVELEGKTIGTLYLRSDYHQTFQALLSSYGLVICGVVLASLVLTVLLSGRLRRIITDPILKLAHTAQTIGENKDYSLRVLGDSRGDELGRLTESFNEMLSRIQSQDAALSVSQQKMEALIHSIDGIVWERTPATFRFTFVSRQSEDILGYPPSAWLEQPGFWEEKLHPQDAAKGRANGARDGGPGAAMHLRIPDAGGGRANALDPGERHGADGTGPPRGGARHLPGRDAANAGRGKTGPAQPAVAGSVAAGGHGRSGDRGAAQCRQRAQQRERVRHAGGGGPAALEGAEFAAGDGDAAGAGGPPARIPDDGPEGQTAARVSGHSGGPSWRGSKRG